MIALFAWLVALMNLVLLVRGGVFDFTGAELVFAYALTLLIVIGVPVGALWLNIKGLRR